jgi:hypothetical protein
MKWTGANERTVKNWLTGRYGPNGEHLIQIFRYSNSVLDAFLRLAGREQTIAQEGLVTLREALAKALTQIDLLMSERSCTL